MDLIVEKTEVVSFKPFKSIYAISVLHDLNGNQRMDYELNGMPKEPYGMSGNDMSMGPPVFDSVKFEVGDSDLHLRIRF